MRTLCNFHVSRNIIILLLCSKHPQRGACTNRLWPGLTQDQLPDHGPPFRQPLPPSPHPAQREGWVRLDPGVLRSRKPSPPGPFLVDPLCLPRVASLSRQVCLLAAQAPDPPPPPRTPRQGRTQASPTPTPVLSGQGQVRGVCVESGAQRCAQGTVMVGTGRTVPSGPDAGSSLLPRPCRAFRVTGAPPTPRTDHSQGCSPGFDFYPLRSHPITFHPIPRSSWDPRARVPSHVLCVTVSSTRGVTCGRTVPGVPRPEKRAPLSSPRPVGWFLSPHSTAGGGGTAPRLYAGSGPDSSPPAG